MASGRTTRPPALSPRGAFRVEVIMSIIRHFAMHSPFALLLLAAPVAAAEIDAAGLFSQLDANADGQLSRNEAGAENQLLFSRLVRTGDENRDGALSAAEFATSLIPVRAEKASVEKVDARIPGADALVVMLARMDADGDLQLESAEIPDQYRPLYERMLSRGDDNKDERLDARELARGGPRLGIMAQMEAARMGVDVQAALEKLPESRRTALEDMDAYPRIDAMMADPEQAGQLFSRLDANGDKRLTADEAPEPLAERFAGMLSRGDRNGDRELDKKEFLELARRFAALQGGGEPTPQSRLLARQMLERFDADGDKRLSAEESPRRFDRAFERSDGNGDSLLDANELAIVMMQFGRMQQMAPGGAYGTDDGEMEYSEMKGKAAGKPGKKNRDSSPAKKPRRARNKQGE